MKTKIEFHKAQLSKIASCIEKGNHFLLTTHVHPDGDCIASILLFSMILDAHQKPYVMVLDDPVPKKFDFLPKVERIRTAEQFRLENAPDVVVILDASSFDRLGRVNGLWGASSQIIHIDHHPETEISGEHIFTLHDSEESSTVELVYLLHQFFHLPITPEVATLVYTGILCDTGRFLFPNTTYRSLEICAEMVKRGAKPGEIAERIYFRNSPESLKALAEALSTLEFHFGGAVACMHLNHHVSFGNERTDTEGFIDFLLTVEGTEVEFFMLKVKPRLFKISFRSKRYVDVNEVAKMFGGGGHIRASGCYIEGTEEEVKQKILNVLARFFVPSQDFSMMMS